MTDKELIQALRRCDSGDCCNCPAEPSDSRCVHEVHWGAVADRLEALLAENERLKAADVAPVRRGRWIRVDDTKCKCSVCDAVAFIAQYPPSADKNYCPNCGARMDGGADNGE